MTTGGVWMTSYVLARSALITTYPFATPTTAPATANPESTTTARRHVVTACTSTTANTIGSIRYARNRPRAANLFGAVNTDIAPARVKSSAGTVHGVRHTRRPRARQVSTPKTTTVATIACSSRGVG